MTERIIYRYSECFKRQVIDDLESGRFRSQQETRDHYGIRGKSTINHWLGAYGRNHLRAKVVRVEKPNEADQIGELKRRIAQLEKALGRTQVEKIVGEEFLKIACERLGEEVEAFKKKSDGKSCTGDTNECR